MVSLKELLMKMSDGTRLAIIRRDEVGPDVETTVGAAWFELFVTGQDFKVEHVTPKRYSLAVTVSPIE